MDAEKLIDRLTQERDFHKRQAEMLREELKRAKAAYFDAISDGPKMDHRMLDPRTGKPVDPIQWH